MISRNFLHGLENGTIVHESGLFAAPASGAAKPAPVVKRNLLPLRILTYAE